MDIYFDACIAIYLIEEHPIYAPIIEARLRDSGARLAYSPLVEMECLVLPLRQKNIELTSRFKRFFELNRRLPITDMVFQIATDLRVKHGLKTPDALHLATTQHHGCGQFWTNDDRLNKAAGVMAVNVLSA